MSLPSDFHTFSDFLAGADILNVLALAKPANTFLGGPTSGPPAVPAFRSLVIADIPDLSSIYQPLDADLTAIAALTTLAFGRGGLEIANAADFRTYIGAGTGGGSVTSVAMTVPGILSVSGSPITTAGTLAVTLATQAANLVFAGPTSGGVAIPTFRSLAAADMPDLSGTYQPLDADLTAIAALTTLAFGRGGLAIANAADFRTYIGAGSGGGSVTSVAMTVPGILSVSGSPITTAGTLAVTLATQAANLVFAGPISGGVVIPAFRSLVAADLPAGTGTITAVTGTAPIASSGGTSPVISLNNGVDAAKLADGTVSNAEFQFINSLTSNAQTQLDGKQALNSNLTTIGGLTPTLDNFIVGTGSAWAIETPSQARISIGIVTKYLSEYASLNVARIAIGSTQTDLIVDTNYTVTTADCGVAMPSNINFRYEGVGMLNNSSGSILTLGSFPSGKRKIFNGTSPIVLATNIGGRYCIEWWVGIANASDISTIVQYVINDISTYTGGGTLVFGSGNWYIKNVNVPLNVAIEGSAQSSDTISGTILNIVSGGTYILKIAGSLTNLSVRNLTLNVGSITTANCLLLQGTVTTIGVAVDHVTFYGTASNSAPQVYADGAGTWQIIAGSLNKCQWITPANTKSVHLNGADLGITIDQPWFYVGQGGTALYVQGSGYLKVNQPNFAGVNPATPASTCIHIVGQHGVITVTGGTDEGFTNYIVNDLSMERHPIVLINNFVQSLMVLNQTCTIVDIGCQWYSKSWTDAAASASRIYSDGLFVNENLAGGTTTPPDPWLTHAGNSMFVRRGPGTGEYVQRFGLPARFKRTSGEGFVSTEPVVTIESNVTETTLFRLCQSDGGDNSTYAHDFKRFMAGDNAGFLTLNSTQASYGGLLLSETGTEYSRFTSTHGYFTRQIVVSSSANTSPSATTDTGKEYRLTSATPVLTLPSSGLTVGKTVFYVVFTGAASGAIKGSVSHTMEFYDSVLNTSVLQADASEGCWLKKYACAECRYVASNTWSIRGSGVVTI